jgi:hypothetical protein
MPDGDKHRSATVVASHINARTGDKPHTDEARPRTDAAHNASYPDSGAWQRGSETSLNL